MMRDFTTLTRQPTLTINGRSVEVLTDEKSEDADIIAALEPFVPESPGGFTPGGEGQTP